MSLCVEIIKLLVILRMSALSLKKIVSQMREIGKKKKYVQIQEDNEERGSRNVNHVQHTIQQHTSHPDPTVNAVTTRSK